MIGELLDKMQLVKDQSGSMVEIKLEPTMRVPADLMLVAFSYCYYYSNLRNFDLFVMEFFSHPNDPMPYWSLLEMTTSFLLRLPL